MAKMLHVETSEFLRFKVDDEDMCQNNNTLKNGLGAREMEEEKRRRKHFKMKNEAKNLLRWFCLCFFISTHVRVCEHVRHVALLHWSST